MGQRCSDTRSIAFEDVVVPMEVKINEIKPKSFRNIIASEPKTSSLLQL